MDIEGLGERMAYTLHHTGLATDIAAIYDLTAEKLMSLPGIKEKGAGNLLRGIEASKQRPLPNVLFALGIRHVGFETARLLAEHIGSLSALLAVDEEALKGIEGIGPVVAGSIARWVERPENRDVIQRLVAAGVDPRFERAAAGTSGPLEGLTLVVTGRLETISRNEAEDRIRELGGKVGSAVTRGTDFLVVGADAGSKLAKAEKLGTTTLDENAFLRLLDEGPGAIEASLDV
jgi:DNA ligase (NAD+)